MENSKVKALFFAQYYKQLVLMKPNNPHPFYLNGMDLLSDRPDYLLLRTVDQLTDDELKTVASILDVDFDAFNENAHFDRDGFLEFVKALFTERPGGFIDCYCANDMLAFTQFLTRSGILLPFTYIDETGKPQTLQPDEIIKLGWAKIKENENTASNSIT